MNQSIVKRFVIGILSLFWAVPSYSSTHVWIAVDVPSCNPELGVVFNTKIKIGAWNGTPGAVDFTIKYDPRILKFLNYSPGKNGPFLPNCYVDTTEVSSGHMRIACFQEGAPPKWDRVFTLGEISWEVISMEDSTTAIDLDVSDMVELQRRPVEVFEFGQNIKFYEDDDPSTPETFALGHNYPNPFNASTIIPFELPEDMHVTIQIYNVIGQRVATVVDKPYTAGSCRAEWQGQDDFGKPVSTGVYFYSVKAGSFMETGKMLLLR